MPLIPDQLMIQFRQERTIIQSCEAKGHGLEKMTTPVTLSAPSAPSGTADRTPENPPAARQSIKIGNAFFILALVFLESPASAALRGPYSHFFNPWLSCD
jgi:hypothetical protein